LEKGSNFGKILKVGHTILLRIDHFGKQGSLQKGVFYRIGVHLIGGSLLNRVLLHRGPRWAKFKGWPDF